MMRMFLIASCAAVVAACSGPDGKDHGKYAYQVIEPTVVDDLRVSMGTTWNSEIGEGGVVTLWPADRTSNSFTMISGYDRNNDGQWEEISVCGYLRRDDGKPSGCSKLTWKSRMAGWQFEHAAGDQGHVSSPSQSLIASWVGWLDVGRSELLRLKSV